MGADQLQARICSAFPTKLAFYTSAHPNAGLPNAFGEYDETPEEMTAFIEAYFKDDLINVIGGCCGTNPAHIKAIYEASQNHKPRQLKHT